MNLWMVTRVEGDRWVVLLANDDCYGIKSMDCFNWSDSFCSRMVRGDGPMIAPNANEVPAYRDAPIAARLQIGSYIGIPLTRKDNSLFGTLCAIDPDPRDAGLCEHQSLVEDFARAISGLLQLAEYQEAESRSETIKTLEPQLGLLGFYDFPTVWQFAEGFEGPLRELGLYVAVIYMEITNLKQHAETDSLSDVKAAQHIQQWISTRHALGAHVADDTYLALMPAANPDSIAAVVAELRGELLTWGIQCKFIWSTFACEGSLHERICACMQPQPDMEGFQTLPASTSHGT